MPLWSVCLLRGEQTPAVWVWGYFILFYFYFFCPATLFLEARAQVCRGSASLKPLGLEHPPVGFEHQELWRVQNSGHGVWEDVREYQSWVRDHNRILGELLAQPTCCMLIARLDFVSYLASAAPSDSHAPELAASREVLVKLSLTIKMLPPSGRYSACQNVFS